MSNAPDTAPSSRGLLSGLKVLDLSHQYSGGLAACLLADLGADVVVVEHPSGSPIRTMLPAKDGQSLWWKTVGRGKRAITLNLSRPEGRDMLLQLVGSFDVLIENFRPGTLERWGLGPADLAQVVDSLVMARISGFGQTGPMRDRPGFGTAAEAISGFAHLNGDPDRPPLFPSTTLGDGVAGTFAAFGAVAALWGKLRNHSRGLEVVDVALFEPLFRLIPTQIPTYDQLGIAPIRPGNFLGSHGVLRNLYQCYDGVYFCVSAVGATAMDRILAAAGAEQLRRSLSSVVGARDTNGFEKFLARADEHLTDWAANRTFAEVQRRLEDAGAVYQRVYDAADIVRDSHFQERGDLVRVADTDLGPVLMPGVVPKFSNHNHEVAHAGPRLGEHNAEIFGEMLGLLPSRIEELSRSGII